MFFFLSLTIYLKVQKNKTPIPEAKIKRFRDESIIPRFHPD